jgi:hypothetical protein
VLSGSERTLTFDVLNNTIIDLDGKIVLESLPGIEIADAYFGSGFRASTRAVFNSAGTVTPGSIVLRSSTGKQCRVVQALRGGVRSECTSHPSRKRESSDA